MVQSFVTFVCFHNSWSDYYNEWPSICFVEIIINNEYFFQLHLDEYNLKYGRENYIVSKILETEISHKVEGHQVIIKLKSISSIFISPKYHRIHNYSLHGTTSMLYILFIEIEAYTLHFACYKI